VSGRRDVAWAEEFGKLIKLLRTGAGLSQEQFAERVGCSRTYPSLLECGKRAPKLSMFIRIAAALNLKPSVLMTMAQRRMEVRKLLKPTKP
jgi:transcriptional regulator with XRE-family HTH domain